MLTRRNAGDAETLDWLLKKAPPVRKQSILHSLFHLIVPHFRLGEHHILFVSPSAPMTDSDDIVYFINGVLATENKARYIVNALSKALKCNVLGMYNPTNGVLLDLLECIIGRAFNMREPIVKSFAKQIKHDMDLYERVFLLGHSQGGIIVSNILKEIAKDEKYASQMHKIHVYTFGSGADEMMQIDHVTHIANNYDFIAQIGVLSFQNKNGGHIVCRNRYGHSFQNSYLPGFISGEYGTDSELYELVRK
jgi:predicted alpha/beta hydrolase family esterase